MKITERILKWIAIDTGEKERQETLDKWVKDERRKD